MAVAAFGLGLGPSRSEAQWALEAQGGRLRSVPGAEPAANGAFSMAIRMDQRHAGFRLATGVPANGDEPLWGAVAGWARLDRTRGSWSAGLDLAAHGALLRGRDGGFRRVPGLLFDRQDRAPTTTASTFGGQALPLVAWDGGRVRVQFRAGVAHVTLGQGGAEVSRTLPLGDLQVTVLATDALALSPLVRRFREPGGELADYAGITAVAARGVVSMAASVGQWVGRDSVGVPWALSATLWPQGRIHLTAGARRDSYDPLTRQPAQTAWSVAVGLKLGTLVRPLAPPVARPGDDGRLRIRLPARAAGEAPRIAGDFTGWTPVPMVREGDHWVYAAALLAGVYQYAFVSPAGEWFVPPSTPGRRDDGMGGHVAVLVVP